GGRPRPGEGDGLRRILALGHRIVSAAGQPAGAALSGRPDPRTIRSSRMIYDSSSQPRRAVPNVLSIAGVDPSGGAGVLADIKAMSALGAYGCGVIAALTAQSTQGVTGVMPVPPSFVRQQIDTL